MSIFHKFYSYAAPGSKNIEKIVRVVLCPCVRVCVCVRARACVLACVYVCACVCKRACVCVCVRASVRPAARALAGVRARGYTRTTAHADARVWPRRHRSSFPAKAGYNSAIENYKKLMQPLVPV